MKYSGPIRDAGEGSADTGPSSLSPRQRAARQRAVDETGAPPTSEALQAAEKATQRSGSGVLDHWLNTMREALYGKPVATYVNRPRFHANVKFLMREGLDKQRILDLITEFGRAVSSGRRKPGNDPWSTFMACWGQLGGSASREGLGAKESRTSEDWER